VQSNRALAQRQSCNSTQGYQITAMLDGLARQSRIIERIVQIRWRIFVAIGVQRGTFEVKVP